MKQHNIDQNDGKKIVVIAEHIQERLRPVTRELMGCAHDISRITGGEVVTVLLYGSEDDNGDDAGFRSVMDQLVRVSGTETETEIDRDIDIETETGINIETDINTGKGTGTEIIGMVVRGVSHPDSSAFKDVLVSLMQELNPAFIVAGHTSQGLDVAPGLSVRLKGACISGVNQVRNHQGRVAFVRSFFKGKFNGVVALEEGMSGPVILTVQPGTFCADIHGKGLASPNSPAPFMERELGGEVNGHVMSSSLRIAEGREDRRPPIHYGQLIPTASKKSKLNQAKVIIAAGRGIGSPENLEDIRRLAACFNGSAVAGSRPLIDMGWLPYEQQVGITGAVVAPDLYLAVGISGSSQHVAGMEQAKFIVSVNKDPHAAIFNVSDVCVVEDGVEFAKRMAEVSQK